MNAILDLARAARRIEDIFPGTPPNDMIQHVVDDASDWSWSLVEIIMDHEERDADQPSKD